VDKLGWGTARAEALLLLERHEEAREAWRSLLLDYSTENYVVRKAGSDKTKQAQARID